jgi:excisionase family DNA binding protein
MKRATETITQKLGEADKIRRDPPLVMGVREVALFLGQSERKTRDDLRLRRIPSLRLGGRILVRRADLELALENLVIGRPRLGRGN